MTAAPQPIANRATPARPCPVCGSGSKGCSVTADALHLCRGEPADPAAWKRVKAGDTFSSYRRADDGRHLRNGHAPAADPQKPARDWAAEAKRYADDLTPAAAGRLAAALGLPADALAAVPLLGFCSDDPLGPCWTFPETDARGRVVCIGRRFPEPVSINGGKPTTKAVMPGGSRGLTVPPGWVDRPGPVLLVEGASDALALAYCGVAAVGRPSNTGGVGHLADLLKNLPRDRAVVVVGENDRKPNGDWPGKAGAEQTAKALGEKLGRPVGVAFPPDDLKDARAWVIDVAAGAGEAVDWPAIGREVVAHCAAAVPGDRFTFIDSADFLLADYRQRYLIERFLVERQPAVGAGPVKTLKTSIVGVEMPICLATGTPFLGQFRVPRPVRVAVVSGESGKATLQETALRIMRAREVSPEALFRRLQFCFDLPQFTDLAGMVEFAEQVKRLEAEVVVIDPVYLCLGGDVDHANMFQMGAAFKVVADVLLKVGVTPVLIHHATKQLKPGSPMEIQHLAYAGLEQFARQFILLNRQSAYRGDGVHDLILSAGGSAGHSGLWDLRIEEGTADASLGGRRWDVTLRSADQVATDRVGQKEAAKEEAARRKIFAEDAKVLDALDAVVSTGAAGATKSKLLPRCPGLSGTKLNNILARLVEEGIVEPVAFEQVTGHGSRQKASGFRRPDRSNQETR